MQEIEKWTSMEEMMTHLGVSRETIMNWINKRSMPANKVGRLWKFKISEVDSSAVMPPKQPTANQRIKAIEKRNELVELDKAWEISYTRTCIICLLTYFFIVVFNALVRLDTSIWLSSLVPVVGFFLSRLSLPLFRKLWEKLITDRK